MKRLLELVILAGLVALACSCASSKNWTYLRDFEYGEVYEAMKAPELKLQPGDEVMIQVRSTKPELAAPFNAGAGLSTIENTASSNAVKYLIDPEGSIDFPVIGKIMVMGKTLKEVKDMIASSIIEMGYIKEPIVDVSMSNFTITVLKETGGNILHAGNGPINLLQVVAQSGTGGQLVKIKDVMVIRTEDGVRKAYSVNLQKKDLFDSPAYYLQQNDIVYFKPKGSRESQPFRTFVSSLSPIFTLGSLVSTFYLWMKLIDDGNE
ncbi:MAG: polysaccharide biosynthesis/export family protein [Bacteroidales bacterium]|nr:polysaccharide biosynthesis/export family protein [Bacteroidales bacterium]